MQLVKIDFNILRRVLVQTCPRWRAPACLMWLSCAGVLICFPAFAVAQDKSTSDPEGLYKSVFKPTFQTHCGKCHGADGVEEGDINLLGLEGDQFGNDVELLSSLIEVLDLGEMPPEGEPDLKPQERQRLIVELKKILKVEVQKLTTFGQAPIRRMNRFQYNNAVIDLLDLKCIVFTLPERMMREHRQYFKPASGKMPDVVTVGNRPLGKSQMIERRLGGVAAFPQDLRAENGLIIEVIIYRCPRC